MNNTNRLGIQIEIVSHY